MAAAAAFQRRSRALGSFYLHLFFHFCLVVYLGAMGTIAPSLTSPLLIACGVILVMLVHQDQLAQELCIRSWPLFAMVAIAIVSSSWSIDAILTIRQAVQLLFTVLLGIVIVAKLGVAGSLKLLIRSMTFICLLSSIWAVAIPSVGVHQATDAYQNDHAGLWRGVLSHKVSLGAFAGAATGLLIFYGHKAFMHPISYVLALSVTVACVLGTASATAILAAAIMASVLYAAYWLAHAPRGRRKGAFWILISIQIVGIFLMYSGLLNQVAILLGKSADLSDRTTYWPHVIAAMNDLSGILGYGYHAGFRFLSPHLYRVSGILLFEAHNGVLDVLVAFGYFGAIVIVGLHLWLFAKSFRLLLSTPPAIATVAVFPFGFIYLIFVLSYAESVILRSVTVWTIGLSMATAITVLIEIRLRYPKPPASYLRAGPQWTEQSTQPLYLACNESSNVPPNPDKCTDSSKLKVGTSQNTAASPQERSKLT
ncbi:MAG: O-antigen ligase family protein [Hyphomicrobiaceae bacterium]|nr:O-antigen ligase family protein [Hyphomicrobiaceae bacterium]